MAAVVALSIAKPLMIQMAMEIKKSMDLTIDADPLILIHFQHGRRLIRNKRVQDRSNGTWRLYNFQSLHGHKWRTDTYQDD